jgi:hypothetical protein
LDEEPPSPEKALIEREFVAKQDEETRRTGRLRVIFLGGFCAGLVSELLVELRFLPRIGISLHIGWVVCVIGYVGVGYLPRTLMQDLDPRWHLNRWSESLEAMGPDRGVMRAALLLTAPWLCRLVILMFHVLALALTPK